MSSKISTFFNFLFKILNWMEVFYSPGKLKNKISNLIMKYLFFHVSKVSTNQGTETTHQIKLCCLNTARVYNGIIHILYTLFFCHSHMYDCVTDIYLSSRLVPLYNIVISSSSKRSLIYSISETRCGLQSWKQKRLS